MPLGKRRDGCGQQLGRQIARQRRLPLAVERAFEPHRAEHHLGMEREVFVHGDGAVRRVCDWNHKLATAAGLCFQAAVTGPITLPLRQVYGVQGGGEGGFPR
jgi:hypothetical protein